MSGAPSFALRDVVALVTGAGGGIGRAVCAALAEAGAHVVGSGRAESPGGTQVDAWFRHDVTSVADWAHLARAIRSRFGRLDCLINGAGISMVESIATISVEQWRNVFEVNVESVLLGMQASLPLLRESGTRRVGGSSIVNMSSVAGLRGVPLNAAYSASKGAVTLLSKSAAKEFAGLGYPIRVNSVHPGRVETRMIDSIMARYAQIGSTASAEAKLATTAINVQSPLGRMATPEEVAGSVVFLCSPAASYMNGCELTIDGGATS